VRYCRAGFLTKAQNAIGDVSRIQVEDRKLESPTRESEQRAADLAIARAELGMARGEFDEARAHIQEATVITRRLGDEFVLNNLSSSRAEIEFLVGDISLAAAYSAEAARGARAIPRGSALLARALCLNAAIRLSTPEGEGGETAAREAFRATSSIGDDALRLISLQNLAARASRRGRPHAAARFLGSLEAWRSATGYHRSAFEEATYRILRSSLHARLGAELETLVAQGGGLTLELATGDVLAID
jgi:ATP/maltotriose-dependent transcriptional regulator MalT